MVNCTLTCGKVTCILDPPSVTAHSSMLILTVKHAWKYASFFFSCLLTEVFGCNLGTGDYGHITTEHASSMLFRNHLSLKEYSNQGFETAHSLQRQLYSKATFSPMTGMVMLHQVSSIFCFFSTLFFLYYHTSQHYST